MKTRDELAETFVVSVLRTFGPDDSAEWEAVVKDGFNLADAFVAERERRAVVVNDAPEAKPPHDPDRGCAGCEHYRPYDGVRPHRCVATGSTLLSARVTEGAPDWCPKRVSATPAAEALRFTASGSLLNPQGRYYATVGDDGRSADVPNLTDGYAATVNVRATDRAHAERIVAAMLPVGRGTK